MTRPVYVARAKLPTRKEGEQPRWITIGAAWTANFQNGEGLSVKIDTMPIGWSGDLILIPPQENDGQ